MQNINPSLIKYVGKKIDYFKIIMSRINALHLDNFQDEHTYKHDVKGTLDIIAEALFVADNPHYDCNHGAARLGCYTRCPEPNSQQKDRCHRMCKQEQKPMCPFPSCTNTRKSKGLRAGIRKYRKYCQRHQYEAVRVAESLKQKRLLVKCKVCGEE